MHRMFFNPYRGRYGVVQVVSDVDTDTPKEQAYTRLDEVPEHLREEAAALKIGDLFAPTPEPDERAFAYLDRCNAAAE